ncbi:hypothetical protein MCEREM3_01305 [Methylophilaceae bacterium]
MQAVNSSTPSSTAFGILLNKPASLVQIKPPTSNKFEPTQNPELTATHSKPSQLLVATCDCV